MALQLLGRDCSYNVQKVLWLAAELELPLQHRQLGGRYGGLDGEAFGAVNPMRKVPVLLDGERVVWESNTILRYLVAAHGGGHWAGDNPYQRSEYERWMDWAQTRFEPAFVGVFWGFYRTPAPARDHDAIARAVRDCEDCLRGLDGQLGREAYLLGPQPTLADICTGVFLYRLEQIDLEVRLPARVQQWYAQLQARDAYRQWVMRDFSALAGRLAY